MLRHGHESMGLRRHRVGDEITEERVRVKHVPGARVVDFYVQVGSRAVTAVAAQGYELSLTHRYVKRGKTCVGHTGLMAVLITAQGCLDTGGESLEVAINGGLTRRMGDVNGITKAVEPYGNAADVAVSDSIDVLTLTASGLDVEASVEVVGSGFSKVSR